MNNITTIALKNSNGYHGHGGIFFHIFSLHLKINWARVVLIKLLFRIVQNNSVFFEVIIMITRLCCLFYTYLCGI